MSQPRGPRSAILASSTDRFREQTAMDDIFLDGFDPPLTSDPASPVTVETGADAPLRPFASLDDLFGTGDQIAQLQLQDVTQKHQQVFQMLSNMSKSMHDTAKAMISSVRA